MTSICIIHIMVKIYWLRNERQDMVLRTKLSHLCCYTHKACASSVYNVKGELNVMFSVRRENRVGGAALQVMV